MSPPAPARARAPDAGPIPAGPAPAAAPDAPAPASGGRLLAASLGLAALLGYAVLRYAVLGREPLASVPLWMTNKAVAVLAVALVAAAAVRPRAAWRGWARSAALAAAALHGLASLALLRPAYYPRLFEGGPAGRMAAGGELAILLGAGALVVFFALGWPRGARAAALPWRAAWLGAGLVAAHCAALGLPRWLAYRTWPGGLPPLSLLGLVLAIVPLAAPLAIAARARLHARRAGRRGPAALPRAPG